MDEAQEMGPDPLEEVEKIFREELAGLGYEVREQQIRMAKAVRRTTLQKRGWSLIEAPCGSGKSAAYVIAGALRIADAREVWEAMPENDRPKHPPKLVISTGGIPLQRQLERDIPSILETIGLGHLRVALLKGRSNYICAELFETRSTMLGLTLDPEVLDLIDLVNMGGLPTGDREDLAVNVSSKAWAQLSVDSAGCAGSACAFADKCFSERARAAAAAADIVITNHHYLVLSDGLSSEFLVIDEAHKLEDTIRSVQGFELREGTGKSFGDRLAAFGFDDEARRVRGLVEALHGALSAYHVRCAGDEREKVPLPYGWSAFDEDAFEPIHAIARMIHNMGRAQVLSGVGKNKAKGKKMEKFGNALYTLACRCEAFADGTPDDEMMSGVWAFWVEQKDGKVTACATPADVSDAVASIAQRAPRAVLTSATLAPGGSYHSRRLAYGVQGRTGEEFIPPPTIYEEHILPSPFDLESMGVTVIPDGPSPKDKDEWPFWATGMVVEAADLADTRTLILCTSLSSMQRFGEALRLNGFRVKVQGDEGRASLISWFAETEDAVLVGSRSLFEGIDVHGIGLLVIDKLPFPQFGCPLEEAIVDMLIEKNGGGTGFGLRTLPYCAEVLDQGAGRLIRGVDGQGALLLLDNRILQPKSWTRVLREALPPFPISNQLDDIPRAIKGEPLEGTPRRRPGQWRSFGSSSKGRAFGVKR